MRQSIKIFFLIIFSISSLYAQTKKRVACIGDSVTKGYNLKTGQSYPEQLQKLLGADYEVGNFGRNGATVLEKGHNPYLKSEELQAALSFNPDIIVVALGLNDTDPRNWPNYKNDFIADYIKLIELLKAKNPKVDVYVCELTPIFSGHPRFLSGTRDWYTQVQNKIGEMAVRNFFKLIYKDSELITRIDLFDDFIHPSAQGAEIIAKNVWKHIIPIQQNLSLHESLGSHMVLQRGKPNTIKGKANSRQTVVIEMNGAVHLSNADNLGEWGISINDLEAGGPYTMLIRTDSDTLLVEDILVGDVYLASGQSNMAFPLKSANRGKQLINQAAANSNIRIYKNKVLAETNNEEWNLETLNKINNLEYFSGKWETVNAENVADFSAIAYSFAENLQQEVGVPIGIVELAVGGSNTESWIPRSALEQDNLLAQYIHKWSTSDFVQDFCRERASVNLKKATLKNQRHPYDPSYNFEAGLSKWKDFPFHAVLWYQGESNAHNVELHEHLFKTLVNSWRKNLQPRYSGSPDLPFYFVQLSSINRPSWPYFRDSQRRLANEIPNVYMAVSSDLGDSLDVHPTEKIRIGHRLANLVKKHQYGINNNADSPQPIRAYSLEDKLYAIEFSHAKLLKTPNAEQAKGFKGMDEKGKLIQLTVKEIKGNTVILENPRGYIEIYYGFEPFSDGNLMNEDSVPVSTFSIKK